MARSTGSLSSNGQAVELDVSGCNRITAFFSGTAYSLTMAFEGTDGASGIWSPLGFSAAHSSTQNSLISLSLTNAEGPRTYHCDRPGVVRARVRASSVTSGSIDVTLDCYNLTTAGASASDGGTDIVEAVDISGFTGDSLAFSGTATHTAQLSAGIYDVISDVDCFIKVGATANDVTTGNGMFLLAGNVIPVRVPTNQRIGAIGAGSGTLRFHRVHA